MALMTPIDIVEPQLSSKRHPLSSQQVVDITRQHNYGTWRFQKGWNPMHIVDAEGCYIVDGSGKRYLDFSSQLMCSNLGHKNQAVIDAIARQAQELSYAMPGYATTARAELSQILLEVIPKGLTKFFFTTSGKDEDHCTLPVLSWFDFRLYRSDWRSSSMGHGAKRQRPRGYLCTGGSLL
jgi:taurine--2-oxoglutarate transaminase